MSRGSNIDDMAWTRNRPSFREACSRGSQTTTDDLDESDCLPSLDGRSIRTPATNVRRASFLLGDLRAIYSSQRTDNPLTPPREQPEVRSPPSSSNPWNIHYRDNVIPELEIVCKHRIALEQKCCSLRDKIERKTMSRCFFCWSKSNLRQLNRDLVVSVENNSNNFFKARRAGCT